MNSRLTPVRAVARIKQLHNTDMTAASLSAWIKTGRCPFGEYLRRDGSSRGIYLIFQDRMDAYFTARSGLPQRASDNTYMTPPTGMYARY